MDTASAVATVVIGAGALVGIITPLLKLNSSIVKLTAKIDQLIDDMTRNERRITKHGEEIERLETTVQSHEFRLNEVEKKVDKMGSK